MNDSSNSNRHFSARSVCVFVVYMCVCACVCAYVCVRVCVRVFLCDIIHVYAFARLVVYDCSRKFESATSMQGIRIMQNNCGTDF